ncbi:MAG: hypothetical protein JWQ90_3312 [Hydrocarboniphaga sp.]|uniref:hypothetical protein n=1 Tax=Hydrocarboniphaga sp. TaxID=2033016 RepID=UPI0026073CE5|nr:hypothetical protein [Hydrocarboniphaga sp.]MDB5970862.1 hypothetical protein [Hydrocarboniphaga sp.]
MSPATSEKVPDAVPAQSLSDAELIARLDRSRNELMEAAGALQKPLHTVQRVENLMRTVLPLLPYAVAAIAVLGVASSLRSGRKLRPVLLIATGLDVWRLWKSYKLTAALPSPGSASVHATRRPDSAQTRTTGYP